MSKLNNPNEVELSDRELQVLELVCCEMRAKEIGGKLGISPRTVEGIKDRLRGKINARSDAGLTMFAIRAKVVDPFAVPAK